MPRWTGTRAIRRVRYAYSCGGSVHACDQCADRAVEVGLRGHVLSGWELEFHEDFCAFFAPVCPRVLGDLDASGVRHGHGSSSVCAAQVVSVLRANG